MPRAKRNPPAVPSPAAVAVRARKQRDKDETVLNEFHLDVPVRSEGVAFTLHQLRVFVDGVIRAINAANVARYESDIKRHASGECLCRNDDCNKGKGQAAIQHRTSRNTQAPRFQERIDALDKANAGGVPVLLEALVYKDIGLGNVCHDVTTNAADLGRYAATGEDRKLLTSVSQWYYRQLIFDIDVDMALLSAVAQAELAASNAFVRTKFCPAIACVLAVWLNEVAIRVGFDGKRIDMPFMASDFVIVDTDHSRCPADKAKLSLHLHIATCAAQTVWFKTLYTPAVLRPIINAVAPQLLDWVPAMRDDDHLITKVFDPAPMKGSQFRLLGQRKHKKPTSGRGTPLRCDPATGHFTVEVPMEVAGPLTTCTNLNEVVSVLLPRVIPAFDPEHPALLTTAATNALAWKPKPSRPDAAPSTLAHASRMFPAYAAESADELAVLEVVQCAFAQSTGVAPHCYFTTEIDDDDDDDKANDSDNDSGSKKMLVPPRRILAFDPLPVDTAKQMLAHYYRVGDVEDLLPDHLDKLEAAAKRSTNGTVFWCPQCIAASGTCQHAPHAHSIFVTKNSKVYLKCHRRHSQKYPGVDDATLNASAKAHATPQRMDSMFRLGAGFFPGFSPFEQETVSGWWQEMTECGLTPLNRTCLRRDHGPQETVRRFIELMPRDNLYVGRAENFVSVVPSQGDPSRLNIRAVPNLGPRYSTTKARFVEVVQPLNVDKGEARVDQWLRPNEFFDGLITSNLLRGDPAPDLALPSVHTILYSPVVCPDGTICSTRGVVAPGTSAYCAWEGGEVPATPPSREALVALLRCTKSIFGRFHWVRRDPDAMLEESFCLLTAISLPLQHLISGGSLGFWLSAATPWAGKTLLCMMLLRFAMKQVVASLACQNTKDTEGPLCTIDEQEFNSNYNSSTAAVTFIDNVPEKARFECAQLEKAITEENVGFRSYHTQVRRIVSARMGLVGNGNDTRFPADRGLCRRVVKLVIESGASRRSAGEPEDPLFEAKLTDEVTEAFAPYAKVIAQLGATLVRMSRAEQNALVLEFKAAGHGPALSGSKPLPGDIDYDTLRAFLWKTFDALGGGEDSWYRDPCDAMMKETVAAMGEADDHGRVGAALFDAVATLQQHTQGPVRSSGGMANAYDALPPTTVQLLGEMRDGADFTWSSLLTLLDTAHNPWAASLNQTRSAASPAQTAMIDLVRCVHAIKAGRGARSFLPADKVAAAVPDLMRTRCPNSDSLKLYVDKPFAPGADGGVQYRLAATTSRTGAKVLRFETLGKRKAM